MESPTRIKVADATTAIAVGGLAGAGIALRSEGEPTVATSAAADRARPVVIHRKRVKRVPAKGPAASSSPPATPASAPAAPVRASSSTPTTVVAAPAQPAVSVPAPEPVSSRTSPAGSGGGEHESDDRGEREGGD